MKKHILASLGVFVLSFTACQHDDSLSTEVKPAQTASQNLQLTSVVTSGDNITSKADLHNTLHFNQDGTFTQVIYDYVDGSLIQVGSFISTIDISSDSFEEETGNKGRVEETKTEFTLEYTEGITDLTVTYSKN